MVILSAIWIILNCHLQDKEHRGIHLSKSVMSHIFLPLEKVRNVAQFETPGGRNHYHLSRWLTNTNTEPSSVYHKPKISPSIQQMLDRPGVRLIGYSTSED